MSKDKSTTVGCIAVSLWAIFTIGWISLLIWAIVTVVNWLVTK